MRGLSVLIAAALLPAAALAQEDDIENRKFIMQSFAAAGKVGNAMAKGETEYNADVADSVLKTLRAGSHAVGAFFPEESDAGENTRASPKIWENFADFEAKLAAFQEDAAAAVQEDPPADAEAFRAAFGPVAENCKGCHDEYRLERRN